MSRWNLAWLLGVTVAALIALTVTYATPALDSDIQAKYRNQRFIIDVLDKVDKEFVKKLDKKKKRKLVVNMLNGYLKELDRHSGVIPEDDYVEFKKQNRGSFGGIGIRFGVKDIDSPNNKTKETRPYVRTPMPGTPAYKAGILADDVIMKINGNDTKGLNMNGVVEQLAGKAGEKVVLSVQREGEDKLIKIPIVRDIIPIESVIGHRRKASDPTKWDYWIDKQTRIGYIRITGFTQTTLDDLVKVVKSLHAKNVRGLVIDLRGNPGGLLSAAVGVSSLFLPEGKTVVTTHSRNQKEEVYSSKYPDGYTPTKKIPIVILVDSNSASASEIVAAALQFYGVAIIIGERTYGKGSVQNVWDMEDGKTALKLTTAIYLPPGGRNIDRKPDHTENDDWGVKPNKGFAVEMSDKEREQFYKWWSELEVIREKGREKPLPKDIANFKDRVLEKALNHLRKVINGKNGQQGGAGQQPMFRAVQRIRELRLDLAV